MTRILIVDDDPNNRRILNYTVSKAGYEPLLAVNGENALQLIGQTEPDLAILDVAMPVMDGITLLQRVRAISKYQSLPVVILTGSGDDEERARAEKLGIQGFLTKPTSSRMILEIINRLLVAHANA